MAKCYAVNHTLCDGAGRQQTVYIDGTTTGPTETLISAARYVRVDAPPEVYGSDGVIDVGMVNEIAVEEVTLSGPAAAALS